MAEVGGVECAQLWHIWTGRDEVLVAQRRKARQLMSELNDLPMDEQQERERVMKQLFKKVEEVGCPGCANRLCKWAVQMCTP